MSALASLSIFGRHWWGDTTSAQTVLLSGDLAHFRENYDHNVVPGFNSNRAETLASIDRIKQIAANLKATVIIQHDPRDVDKLPAFPAFAK
jgi:N-acyl homoserine lactone hydrolase